MVGRQPFSLGEGGDVAPFFPSADDDGTARFGAGWSDASGVEDGNLVSEGCAVDRVGVGC